MLNVYDDGAHTLNAMPQCLSLGYDHYRIQVLQLQQGLLQLKFHYTGMEQFVDQVA